MISLPQLLTLLSVYGFAQILFLSAALVLYRTKSESWSAAFEALHQQLSQITLHVLGLAPKEAPIPQRLEPAQTPVTADSASGE